MPTNPRSDTSRAYVSGARLTRIAAFVLVMVFARTMAATAITLPESIPDFSLDPSRPVVQSAQSGPWSNAATWQGGQVPTANHIVRILSNHVVTIDDISAVAYTVAIDGKLAFAASSNTRLKVTNLMVMAGDMGMGTPGVLEVGTATTPIAATATAEIVIANTPLGDSVADPLQFGTGLIVLGRITMHGSVRTPTFVRLAAEPHAGQTTLTLSEAVSGWRIGDRLVLPDTRHIKESEVTGSGWINTINQWEERTLAAVSADGRTLTLTSALQYDHLGARDLNGTLDFLPHVGNLTRNVVVRSESASVTRGHAIMTHLANADIRYVQFKDLGRTTYLPLNTTTNAIGRYPVHMHHLSGPLPTPVNGYQFTLLGNAVDGGSVETQFKWGIAVHGSHYGLIQDNVVYNYNGAAIATEDGSESFNVFDHNFALRGMGEPNDSVSEARMAMGTEGVGFWFRGPNNFVRNNVAANYQNPTTEAAYGYAYQLRFLGDVAVPNIKGAHDMAGMPSQFTTRNGNNMPILQFENNEAYGAMQGGFTQWWVSSLDPEPSVDAKESIIKGLKLWHVYNKAVYMYPGQKITFDGLKIRGNFDPAVSRCCGNGVYFADYSSKGIVIRNSDIQGMEEGITAPEAGRGPGPNLTVLNSYLRNISNLDVPTNGSVNGCWMDAKLVMAINTRFDTPPGQPADNVAMVRDVASAPECLAKLDEMRVYAYNGVAGDNFQVYHTNASVLPRPPAGCTTTRPGINGITCPIAAIGAVPTADAAISPVMILAGQPATLSWTTTGASTVSLDQGIGTVAASGALTVFPTATTTYILTATNTTASVTAAATVLVTNVSDAPPIISGVTTSSVTAIGATVNFTTNEPSSHQIEYGTTASYGTLAILDSTLRTAHSQILTGLNANTLYHYRVRATDAAGNTGVSGDFTFTTAAGGTQVTAETVTPASGSGLTQTFALRYGDTLGALDLSTAWVWVNATFAPTTGNSCLAYYARATNTINLLNDAATAYASGTVGSGAVLQNSQCAIALGNTTVAASGTTVTVNLALTFAPRFSGAKNVYIYAANGAGVNSGWQTRGTWTVPAAVTPAVTADGVTPASGSGASQTFALQYGDTVGALDLSTAWVWVNATFAATSANSCLAYYTRATNTISLLNDAATAYASGTVGSGAVLQNSQCGIALGNTTVALSGNSLTVNLALTFAPGFNGAKNVYIYAANAAGLNSGWQPRGTWTVPAAMTPALTAEAVTPASGSGAAQTFALRYGDTAGALDLSTAWVWVNATFAATSTNSCLAYYTRATNTISLLNDAATAYASGAVGSGTVLQNSQCTIALGNTSVAVSGTTLTVNLALTFAPGFNGAKNVYLYAANAAGLNSGWQARGTWTVPAAMTPAVTADSVTPASGAGPAQTFSLRYGDNSGALNLSTAWVWVNATFAATSSNSCLAYYTRATNTISLLNDAATAYASGAVGTGTVLQNSQCSIALGNTTVAVSGTALTVNLALTFAPQFAGAKNIYIYAANAAGINSGWQTRGTWTVGAPVVTADSATPASGSGATQTFALRYGDTAGASDLSTTWVWVNATFAATTANSCLAYYTRATNTISLLNDAATAYAIGTVGSGAVLQNSQCSIALGSTTVTLNGTALTLNLALTFRPSFQGAKQLYLYAASGAGPNSGWQTRGTWTIP